MPDRDHHSAEDVEADVATNAITKLQKIIRDLRRTTEMQVATIDKLSRDLADARIEGALLRSIDMDLVRILVDGIDVRRQVGQTFADPADYRRGNKRPMDDCLDRLMRQVGLTPRGR